MKNFGPGRCPHCGWWASEPSKNLTGRSEPERSVRKCEEFGVEAFDWEETWMCPCDGTVFTFKNSNC